MNTVEQIKSRNISPSLIALLGITGAIALIGGVHSSIENDTKSRAIEIADDYTTILGKQAVVHNALALNGEVRFTRNGKEVKTAVNPLVLQSYFTGKSDAELDGVYLGVDAVDETGKHFIEPFKFDKSINHYDPADETKPSPQRADVYASDIDDQKRLLIPFRSDGEQRNPTFMAGTLAQVVYPSEPQNFQKQ